MLKHFLAILKARTMEFVRDRESLIWNLLFPILIVIGFAVAIPGGGGGIMKVGTVGQTPVGFEYAKIEQITFIAYDEPKEDRGGLDRAVEKLRQHQLDLVIDYGTKRFWSNEESASSKVARRLFLDETGKNLVPATAPVAVPAPATAPVAALANPLGFSEQAVSGKPIRYVDRLVSGAIGMNMMFSCLFGMGYVIVRYRKNGVLKRLKATPVNAFTFITAQLVSRFFIVLATAIFVYFVTNLLFGFHMEGSYLLLIGHTALSILCLCSIGLIFATRMKSEELANGLVNLIIFPMIVLSGVFFSLEGGPAFLTTVAQFFPLTHFIDGARAIMLDGAGFMAILPHMGILAGMTVVFLAIASALFKWE